MKKTGTSKYKMSEELKYFRYGYYRVINQHNETLKLILNRIEEVDAKLRLWSHIDNSDDGKYFSENALINHKMDLINIKDRLINSLKS